MKELPNQPANLKPEGRNKIPQLGFFWIFFLTWNVFENWIDVICKKLKIEQKKIIK